MNTIPQIFFAHAALEKMRKIAQTAQDTETGGLLLGKVCRYRTGRAWIVSQITGPGPKAVLSSHSFLPDMEYYRKARSQYSDLVYLGEWHKHPGGYAAYSEQDFCQVKEILSLENREEFLCAVWSGSELQENSETLAMRCFYLHEDLPQFLPLSHCALAQLQDNEACLHYLAVEDRVVERFLASRKPYWMVAADVYPERGVAHLFAHPLTGNETALLVNSELCPELDLSQETSLVVTVCKEKGKPPHLRGYYCIEGGSQEITTEVISLRKDMFSRNRGMLETTRLKGKHVVILGLGSIGADAALELTRAGVNRFTLIDSDSVKIENLCRHACDLTELGMSKVEAVAGRIRKIMPYAEIRTHAVDVSQNPQKTLEICEKSDLIFVATDTENSRRLANWIGHEEKIPLIYAGLLERAVGGRVWRVIPGETACYDCYPSQESLAVKGPIPYSEISSLDKLAIQPGLGNDIAFVTHLAVRLALDTLKGKGDSSLPYHMLFWFNRRYRRLQGSRPLTLYRVEKLSPRVDCAVCSRKKNTEP